MLDLIIPEVIDRMYRDLARPRIPQPQAARVTAEAPKVELTKTDVTDILARKRTASPEELEYVISHAQQYALTTWQVNQISVDATIAVAQRSRALTGRSEDPNLRFISQTLGLVPTPFGLIERSFIESVLKEGSQNIYHCRRHLPPSCSCWASQRAILWEAGAHGEQSAEGWTSARLFEILEDLELTSRRE
jgi:hypothetical protein